MAASVDVVAVLLFVAIGRASHHHASTVGGFVSTLWPFAVGLVAGWAATRGRRPAAKSTGASVAALTVALGMILRVLAGQGTAAAFILVALAFLGTCMVAGRLLAGALVARRAGA